ncbi:DEAD/DEAH box helicase family protein [Salinarimonas rosea]|uniref:DEAD/DEAH box helicase family protein n=1 Tax=Salinarimonas rosea TaxID=552063 RepID=UPI000424462B|nr:DEAD/DEAH box helicase family protein [Salinarimonas rosea]
MTIHYFNALAGAGKTRALARYADRLARRNQKVLFVQPTKLLIDKTIADELRTLDPPYQIRAIHGDTEPDAVVGEIVRHFQDAESAVGEVLFVTHAGFLLIPFIQRKREWVLIMDEVPAVDVFRELTLPETHELITPHLALVSTGAAYGLLVEKEDVR